MSFDFSKATLEELAKYVSWYRADPGYWEGRMDNFIERLKRLHAQLVSSNADTKETVELLGEAIAEIEWLRSHVGAVSRGEGFDDIAKRMPLRVTDEQKL